MDNVLGVLFQDIADAIRAKTGGTDTMKPNEFPTQIAAIETGGGGGGVELDDVYWAYKGYEPYETQYKIPFVFQNQLYFWCNKDSSTSEIYKYVNGELILQATSPFIVRAAETDIIEVNGKVHLFTVDYKHMSWDGATTFTTHNNTPVDWPAPNYACAVGGEIYLRGYSAEANIIYKWDEITDTWNAWYTNDVAINVLCGYDGKIYMNLIYNEGLYALDVNTQSKTFEDVPVLRSERFYIINGNVYQIRQYNHNSGKLYGGALYKNGTIVALIPSGMVTVQRWVVLNGIVYLTCGEGAPWNKLLVSTQIP